MPIPKKISEYLDDIQYSGDTKKNCQSLAILLQANKEGQNIIFSLASRKKKEVHNNFVFLRGLIEVSNHCHKNCLYCGIRQENQSIDRYLLTYDEIIATARFAWQQGFGSIVLQSGENQSNSFSDYICQVIAGIHKQTNSQLQITLSLGEQGKKTYQKWFDAGASRYLLRIETSSPDLYKKIHPSTKLHDFSQRIDCLFFLKEIGYQLGTGVMIGLPWQTISDLAQDLLFFQNLDVDMVGMGPYMESEYSPWHHQPEIFSQLIISKEDRFDMTMKMVALLRIMMPDINIAATTAMQEIAPAGREKALQIGANVIMPNITPTKYRQMYQLYKKNNDNEQNLMYFINIFSKRMAFFGQQIKLHDHGTSKHFAKRQKII